MSARVHWVPLRREVIVCDDEPCTRDAGRNESAHQRLTDGGKCVSTEALFEPNVFLPLTSHILIGLFVLLVMGDRHPDEIGTAT